MLLPYPLSRGQIDAMLGSIRCLTPWHRLSRHPCPLRKLLSPITGVWGNSLKLLWAASKEGLMWESWGKHGVWRGSQSSQHAFPSSRTPLSHMSLAHSHTNITVSWRVVAVNSGLCSHSPARTKHFSCYTVPDCSCWQAADCSTLSFHALKTSETIHEWECPSLARQMLATSRKTSNHCP